MHGRRGQNSARSACARRRRPADRLISSPADRLEMLKHVGIALRRSAVIQKENAQRRISGFSPIYSMLRWIQSETGQVLRANAGSRKHLDRDVCPLETFF